MAVPRHRKVEQKQFQVYLVYLVEKDTRILDELTPAGMRAAVVLPRQWKVARNMP